MYPKCGIKHCQTREFRYIGQVGKKHLYQCANGHVFMQTDTITDNPNPLAVLNP